MSIKYFAIDVSSHQGHIDWEKVKQEILSKGHSPAAIIRCGFGKNNIDSQAKRNLKECNRLGIPVGAYWYSYAYTKEMAEKEAEYLLDIVKDYKIELPLVFDWEGTRGERQSSFNYAVINGVTPTPFIYTELVTAFCDKIQNNGYYAMNYMYLDLRKRLYTVDLDKYDVWFADLGDYLSVDCGIWQFDHNYKINGISGPVDANKVLKDYPKILYNAGLNHLEIKPKNKKYLIKIELNEEEMNIAKRLLSMFDKVEVIENE